MLSRSRLIISYIILFMLMSTQAFADGAVVDKIYNPYVEALEKEIEYRFIVQDDDNDTLDGVQIHRLGFGLSWTDRWFSEVYLIGERTSSESLTVEAYELETKWQITEQGEFWADWGLLFELETERDKNIWEYNTTLLTSKEWGRWVTTTNLGLIYEWGNDIANEWETTLSVQSRYRLSPAFEPALEFYTGQDTKALGPVFTGLIRTAGNTKLRWEVGLIFGLDTISPERTFRGLLEFEFY